MQMKLEEIHFNNIINKKKLYETRIYDKKRREIKLLDEITFINKNNTTKTFKGLITELSYFENFKLAIEEVGIKKVLPNVKSLKDGIEIYNNFPHGEGGTYKEAAKKYGVLRMKFELLKK